MNFVSYDDITSLVNKIKTKLDGKAEIVQITQAAYDALTQEEKLNGKIYFITDGNNATINGNSEWIISLTQAEYDALTSEEKNEDVFYYITDSSSLINEGDMKKSDYDGDRAIQAAGGIKAYVDGAVGTKQATLTFDNDYLVI